MNKLTSQCCIACFEGLLPSDHNKIVMDLLFVLGTWHALAKLHLHTTYTIAVFTHFTKEVGVQMRRFKYKVCPAYETRELPKEQALQIRRQSKKASREQSGSDAIDSSAGLKEFSISTYKYHALGHYPDQIPYFSTLDTISVQRVHVST